MEIIIRQETIQDYEWVDRVIQTAFTSLEISDHNEHHLVSRLRSSEAFIPELSLVAEIKDQIVGHILLTRIRIENETDSHQSLALAPVSVLPNFQGKGVGGALITKSHQIAKILGFGSIVLVGHAEYYPRFGYEVTTKYHIKLPFEAPEECCLIKPLTEQALVGVRGMVVYPQAFFD